jgi:hypothetical protein
LLTASCLLAGDVIAVLVVNVDTVQFLVFDNVDKGCGEFFFLAEAVVPAVILVTCVKRS